MLIQQFRHCTQYPSSNTAIYSHDCKDLTTDSRLQFCQPSEAELNRYLKKVFIQRHELNDHVDNVRKNYIKRKNKKLSVNESVNRSSCKLQESSHLLLNESVRQGGIHDYLKQLEEDSKKNNLPEEIRSNTVLCTLYQKLDLFENNLISQQKKEQQSAMNNHNILSEASIAEQRLTQQQVIFRKKVQLSICDTRSKLQQKEKELDKVKQKFSTSNYLSEFSSQTLITHSYVKSLLQQTSKNLWNIRQRLQFCEENFRKIKQSQLQMIEVKSEIESLNSEVKDLLCELHVRKEIFE